MSRSSFFSFKMENLTHMAELRVLNLAGNQISLVENVSGLNSLTELNLRRNKITQVVGLDELPSLQRVFLSNNLLRTFDHFACIFQVKVSSRLPVCQLSSRLPGPYTLPDSLLSTLWTCSFACTTLNG
jgi:hypothetical protein